MPQHDAIVMVSCPFGSIIAALLRSQGRIAKMDFGLVTGQPLMRGGSLATCKKHIQVCGLLLAVPRMAQLLLDGRPAKFQGELSETFR